MTWFDKVNALPFQRVIIIALGIAAFYYFVAFDDGTNLDAIFDNQSQVLQQEEELLEKTKKARDDAFKFEQDVKVMRAQFQELIKFLPPEWDVAILMLDLTKEAKAAGAEVIKVEPKAKGVQRDFYETMNVELELKGTYSQVVLFLSLLSKLPRLLTIDDIEMIQDRTDPDAPRVQFRAKLVSYRYVGNTEDKAKQSAGSGAGL